ncbi:speckle-type POZ protein-like [Mesocricetus auratus]|uniref:Speckle-type POZ protein-like n=1 Tax=Mesocricetus auratus TaxID=10036 RepID=A0ABM2X1U1_MESAU|nr:speckle-type POZ protein-like [Mesocricetus auratus]
MLLSSPRSPAWAKFQFWIINSEVVKTKDMKIQRYFMFLLNEHWGFSQFILQDFLLSEEPWILQDDELILRCKVTVVQDAFGISEQRTMPGIQVPRYTMADELGELWENSLFTDCCLVVAGKEFWAHKAIFAARSPVFRAMFEHDTVERRKKQVEIHDLELRRFKAMMGLIYTKKAPDLHYMADAVLAAADKYGLESLKVMCQEVLCKDHSVENTAHILILADLHSEWQLKTEAMNFITAHFSEVSETSSWKTMLVAESYSTLFSAHCSLLKPPPKCLKQSWDTLSCDLYVYSRSSSQHCYQGHLGRLWDTAVFFKESLERQNGGSGL